MVESYILENWLSMFILETVFILLRIEYIAKESFIKFTHSYG